MTHDTRPITGLDDDDLEVAHALRGALAPLDLPYDADAVTALDATAGPDADWPSGRRRRVVWLAGAAAAVVAGATVVGVVGLPGSTSSAWAASPTAVSSSDAQKATTACAALAARPLGGGGGTTVAVPAGPGASGTVVSGSVPNGGGQPAAGGAVSGVVSGDVGSATAGTSGTSTAGVANQPAPASLPTPPTTLPPLAVVDRRGDHALAVFEDAAWSFSCMLAIDGDTWTGEGLMIDQASSAQGQPVSVGMMSSSGGAGASNSIAGAVPDGVTRVTLGFGNGVVADATVTHGHFAAWYPGDFGAQPPTITMYDASGAKVA